MANSEYPNEMPCKATFHQGLHCLLRQNMITAGECIACNPSIYTMDHPDLSVSNFMEKSVGLKRVDRRKQ